MKRIRKTVKNMLLFWILTGALCACQKGQESGGRVTLTVSMGTSSLTPEVTVAVTPEVTKTPSLTEPAIPIDETHFTSAVFREFIKEEYDKDSDGFLSWTERGAVTKMQPGGYNFSEECLDGFEYFPNLTDIDAENFSARQVIIRNHPVLQAFGGSEGWGPIGTLQIENCPALTNIGFYAGRIDLLSVSGAPLAALSLDDTIVGSMILDADMTLWGSVDERHGVSFYRINEDGVLVYYESEYVNGELVVKQQTPVEFTNRKEPQFPFSEEYWTECLANSEFGELELFRVQISEKEEAGYNEKGQKGYAVRVFYTRSNHDYGDKTFVIYADEMPVREQFVVRPAAINGIEAVEYSPNRGVCVLTKWDLAVVYQGGEEEQVLDVFDRHEHYCAIAADGAVKAVPVSRAGRYHDSLLRFMLTGTASNADSGAGRADSD